MRVRPKAGRAGRGRRSVWFLRGPRVPGRRGGLRWSCRRRRQRRWGGGP